MTAEKRFFEIVNWKKAQPRMKGKDNDWMKLYTSLLDNEAFFRLDNSSRVLLIGLWLYTARSGLHIFPADPGWIWRKIPMLHEEPNLRPLMEATDCYGNPNPFIQYCNPPKVKSGKIRLKSAAKKKEEDQSRIEQNRREERDEKKSLRISEEQKNKKRRISKRQQTETDKQTKTQKSVNPIESDAGSAKVNHFLPKPTRSANRNIQSLGTVLNDWLPTHWQDPDAEAFGWNIVRALGYGNNTSDIKIRSEWGAFASWWIKIKESAPYTIHNDIWNKAIDKANYLRTKNKSAKNKSAVWFIIMHGELNKWGINIPKSIRASPL